MSQEKSLVANNAAVFGWTFMIVWMAMLCAFTWLAVRDHGVPGYSSEITALFLAGFWLFGLAGCNFFLRMPRVRLLKGADGLRLEEIWLWRRRSSPLASTDLQTLALIEDTDTDGDPYFKCAITLPDGRPVFLKESHLRGIVEDAMRLITEGARTPHSRPNVSSKE
jgi:hypothetical protein